MRGAPQRGLSRLIRRISSRVSTATLGRPLRRRDFHPWKRRKPLRCQPTTHLPNQFSNFHRYGRTPRLAVTNLPRPEQPKPLAVPADHRLRFDDDKGGPPVLPKLAQLRPEKSISSGQLGSFHGPLQHTKLVPQGEDLELKDRSRTEHRQNRREQCGDHEGRGESPKEGQLPISQPNRIFREPQSVLAPSSSYPL